MSFLVSERRLKPEKTPPRTGVYIGSVKIAEIEMSRTIENGRTFGLSFLDEFHNGFKRRTEAMEYLKMRLNQDTPEGPRPQEEDENE